MQHCLKTLSAGLIAACAAFSASALDNTVSNDFWCTWNYVNPSTNEKESTVASFFDTFLSNEMESDVLQRFSSEKPAGFVLVVRLHLKGATT